MSSRKRTYSGISTPARSRVRYSKPEKAKSNSMKLYKSPAASTPFANQKVCTLTYVQSTYMNFTAGVSAAQQQYACNGMYDPDYTGAGHQPRYFDQLIDLYAHYCVTSSTMDVWFTDKYHNSYSMVYAAAVDDDYSNYVSPQITAEQPGATLCASAPGSQISHLKQTWRSKAIFPGDGLSKQALSGDAGANPAEISSFVICANEPTGVRTEALYMLVKITYTAVFYELKTIGGS